MIDETHDPDELRERLEESLHGPKSNTKKTHNAVEVAIDAIETLEVYKNKIYEEKVVRPNPVGFCKECGNVLGPEDKIVSNATGKHEEDCIFYEHEPDDQDAGPWAIGFYKDQEEHYE